MSKGLKAWYDGSDTVVAESAEDAAAVWEQFMGEPWSDEGWDDYEWEEKPGDSTLRIRFHDDQGGVPKKYRDLPSQDYEEYTIVVATCDEWVARCGRGWLCSENI